MVSKLYVMGRKNSCHILKFIYRLLCEKLSFRKILNSEYFMFRILFFMRLVWGSISGFWPYVWETMNCTCEEGSLILLKYNRWRLRLGRRNTRSSWKGMEFIVFHTQNLHFNVVFIVLKLNDGYNFQVRDLTDISE